MNITYNNNNITLDNTLLHDFINYSNYEMLNDNCRELINFLNDNGYDEGVINITIDDNNYKIISIYDDCEQATHYWIAKENFTAEAILINEYSNVDGDTVYNENCMSDYDIYTCDYCGEYHYEDNILFTEDDYRYCEDCADDYSFTCQYCENRYSNNYEHNTDNDGDIYCCNCYDYGNFEGEFHNNGTIDTASDNVINYEDISSQNCINSYHNYDRDFIKRKLENEDNQKLFFGVELEVERKDYKELDTGATFVRSNLNCVTANDSSLTNGFEIISDPQSLNYWLSRRNKIDNVFNQLVERGFTSHDSGNCGLHIHVSRSGLGETEEEQKNTIARLELILENFKEQVKIFSRRTDFYWCHFLGDDTPIEFDIEDIKGKLRSNHRCAINLEHSATIEFRIFRGTLKTETFYASLELVANLVEIAKNGNYKGMTWSQLIKLNNYSDLMNYNSERAIKCLSRIKDYTDIFRKKAEQKDKRIIKLAEKQKVKIDNMNKYIKHNILYINFASSILYDNYMLDNLTRNDNNKRPFYELAKNIYNISRVYRDIETLRHKTLNNEIIIYYDDDYLNKSIDDIINAIETLKKEMKEAEVCAL